MDKKRLVNTPRVEIGSEQYKKDADFMKLFDSYEEYLAYLEAWQGIKTTYHPSTAPTVTYPDNLFTGLVPLECFADYWDYLRNAALYFSSAELDLFEVFATYEEYLGYLDYRYGCSDSIPTAVGYLVKDKTRASRMKTAAARHKRAEALLVSHQKKAHKDQPSAVPYKRVRVLQPQCIETAYVQFNDRSRDAAFLQAFEAYEEYLDYLAECYDGYEAVTVFDVTGLRLSEYAAGRCKSNHCGLEMTTTHAENLSELRLIKSAMPRLSKKAAKHILALIHSTLGTDYKLIQSAIPGLPKKSAKQLLNLVHFESEDKDKMVSYKSVVEYLLTMLRPDLTADVRKELSKTFTPRVNYAAYKELRKLIEAIYNAIEEAKNDNGKGGDEEEDEPASGSSDKASDEADPDGASHVGTYVNRRPVCSQKRLVPNKAAKETPAPVKLDNSVCIPGALYA